MDDGGSAQVNKGFKGGLLRAANRTLRATGVELRRQASSGPASKHEHLQVQACPLTPPPAESLTRRVIEGFRNEFPISPGCKLTGEEIEKAIAGYYWHYPFKFGDRLVEASYAPGRGLKMRHHKRFVHFMPTVVDQLGGSFDRSSVLDLGCNCGFWSIQARLFGAPRVLGVEGGPENVEQGRFILDLIGLDGIEYRVGDATKITRESVGEFDVTLLLGLLYHVNEPMGLLQALADVTKRMAVVDTSVIADDTAFLNLKQDEIHGQNFDNSLSIWPSRGAVPLMLRSVGFREVLQIPVVSKEVSPDYLQGRRVTYLAFK